GGRCHRQIDGGAELLEVASNGGIVEKPKHLRRRGGVESSRAHGMACKAGQSRRPRSLALDVADGDAECAVLELPGVVEVSSHLAALAGRHIAGTYLDAVQAGQRV